MTGQLDMFALLPMPVESRNELLDLANLASYGPLQHGHTDREDQIVFMDRAEIAATAVVDYETAKD